MAEIYEVHGLVQRLGKDAIVELFRKLSVEVDADWAESEKKDLARLAKTLSQLPEERQDEIGRIFDDILEVGGTKSQIPVIMGALEDFGVTPPEHFEHASAPVRAAWCYVNLERRQWMCLRHRTANTNLKKSEWKHFGLAFPEPPEMGCVAAAQKKLEKNLVTAIRKAEHRGHHCRSDCYAVESREITIFKLTDHPDAEDVWDDNLQDFRPSDNHLAFRIVLSFDHESERMAIHHPSNPKLCARLSRIFADTIFGKDGYSDLSEVFYNLNYFRNKSQLPPSPKHGILNARVTGLELYLEGSKDRRRTYYEHDRDIREVLKAEVPTDVFRAATVHGVTMRLSCRDTVRDRISERNVRLGESSVSGISTATTAVQKCVKAYLDELGVSQYVNNPSAS